MPAYVDKLSRPANNQQHKKIRSTVLKDLVVVVLETRFARQDLSSRQHGKGVDDGGSFEPQGVDNAAGE